MKKRLNPYSSAFWQAVNKAKIRKELKLWGFFTAWLAIPLAFIVWVIQPQPVSFQPAVYQTEEQFSVPPGVEFNFKIRFKGVRGEGADSQPIFLQAVSEEGNGQSFTFERLLVSQDKKQPEIFQGTIDINPSLVGKKYTFWIKGPVHLQRRFEGVALTVGEELDFTQKPLLAGDLVLPETGQDEKVDELDRDYLWSLLAAKRRLTKEEIKSADLDLDGEVTTRDQSLLLDTGLGIQGEK